MDESISVTHKQLADEWFQSFGNFTVFENDSPTVMLEAYLSTLDHIFTNFPIAVLFDLQPQAHYSWNFRGQFVKASEHSLVAGGLGMGNERLCASVGYQALCF